MPIDEREFFASHTLIVNGFRLCEKQIKQKKINNYDRGQTETCILTFIGFQTGVDFTISDVTDMSIKG